MAIKLKKIQRANPRDITQSKWYLIQENSGSLGLNEIAKEISGRSASSQGDVSNVLRNLVEVMPTFMKLGQTIRLEGFGSFHISVQSEGTDTAEQLSVHNVKNPFRRMDLTASFLEQLSVHNVKNAHIVFIPSTTLKEGIEHLSYDILTDHAAPTEHTDPPVSGEA
jgi:nucleoid DNA-binding protein